MKNYRRLLCFSTIFLIFINAGWPNAWHAVAQTDPASTPIDSASFGSVILRLVDETGSPVGGAEWDITVNGEVRTVRDTMTDTLAGTETVHDVEAGSVAVTLHQEVSGYSFPAIPNPLIVSVDPGTTVEATLQVQSIPPDTDGDGVDDSSDNCPEIANADQSDSDADGTGDACQPTPVDTDLDGLSDQDELTLGTDPLLADTDGDGVPDGDEIAQGSNPLAPPDAEQPSTPVVDSTPSLPDSTPLPQASDDQHDIAATPVSTDLATPQATPVATPITSIRPRTTTRLAAAAVEPTTTNVVNRFRGVRVAAYDTSSATGSGGDYGPDGRTSLQPGQLLACGGYTHFWNRLNVGTGGVYTFQVTYATRTNNGERLGFDRVGAIYLDTSDSDYNDTGSTASVSWQSSGSFASGGNITVTYVVRGLDAGDVILVRTSMHLRCDQTQTGSNIQSALVGANQTVPLSTSNVVQPIVSFNMIKSCPTLSGNERPGDSITYSVTIYNTGTVTLNFSNLVDTRTGTFNPTNTSSFQILAGEQTTYTFTSRITAADASAGHLNNRVDVTYRAAVGGTTGTRDANAFCPYTPPADPALSVIKTGALDTGTDGLTAGDVITYTIRVRNTGAVPLNNVAVTDAITGTAQSSTVTWTSPAGFNGTIPSIPVGQTVELTATYAVTQADIDSGSTIRNCATATSGTASDQSCYPLSLQSISSLLVSKTGSLDRGNNGLTQGDVITYAITVTNTGNSTLTSIAVDDYLTGTANPGAISWASPAGFNGVISSLAPGQSITLTGTYAITQDDIDTAAAVDNCAIATASSGATGEDCYPLQLSPTTSLDVAKIGQIITGDNGLTAGDEIFYTISVQNTGQTTLRDVSVADDITGTSLPADIEWRSPDGFDGTIAQIGVGSTVTLTGVYVITQADIDTGAVIQNCVSATSAGGADDTCITNALIAPSSLDVAKSGVLDDGGDGLNAGDAIRYEIVVTNTGRTTLRNISVADELTGQAGADTVTWTSPVGFDGQIDVMNVGSSETLTAEYLITQDDIDAGFMIENCATATTESGLTNTSCVTTTGEGTTGLTVAKSGVLDRGTDGLTAGDVITYQIVVENTGETTLRDVNVSDEISGTVGDASITWTSPDGFSGTISEIPAESDPFVITGTYTITQDDIDQRSTVLNCAMASTGTVSDESGFPIQLNGSSAMDVAKTGAVVTGDDGLTAGDQIVYTIVVTNTGETTLTNINLADDITVDADPDAEVVWTSPAGFDGILTTPIAPGDPPVTVTATYTLTQEDIDQGLTIQNCVSASADNGATSASCFSNTLVGTSAVDILKTGSLDTGSNGLTAGDVITYEIVVTNTGKTTLTNIVVNDTITGSPGEATFTWTSPDGFDGTIPSLEVGSEPFVITGTYTVTQADIDTGVILTNCAEATTAVGATDTDCVPIRVQGNPAINVDKAGTLDAGDDGVNAGDQIVYTITIQNTGQTTLTNVAVTDELTSSDPASTITWTNPSNFDGTIPTIAVGESVTLTGTYAITQADIDAGLGIENCASVSAEQGIQDQACVTTTPLGTPSLTIDKLVNPTERARVGDVLTYSFVVTNTGDVTLEGVTVEDPLVNLVWDQAFPNGLVGVLAPNESVTVTATYVVTDADLNTGRVTNVATASGAVAGCTENCLITSPPDSTTVPVSNGPSMTIDKTSSPTSGAMAGDTVTWIFTVTNTGDADLRDVVIQDSLDGIVWDPAHPNGTIRSLPVGTTVIVTATYIVTEADVAAGSVTNVALAEGIEDACDPATDEKQCTVTTPEDSATVGIDQPTTTPTVTPNQTPVTPTQTSVTPSATATQSSQPSGQATSAAETPTAAPVTVTSLPATGRGASPESMTAVLAVGALIVALAGWFACRRSMHRS